MAAAMTSASQPLRIDWVAAPGGGVIGMTLCPGKKQDSAHIGNWDRDLGLDLDRVQAWGPAAVVTLMEAWELKKYKVERIGQAVTGRGIAWYHLPIVDGGVPDEAFERAWVQAGSVLRVKIRSGHRVLLHCRGGLGRTGTIAARLLVELGMPAEEAIASVRHARAGAIETSEQESTVRGIKPAEMEAHPPEAVLPPVADAGVLDRARGAMLGLAIGDALGTTLEFKPRDSYPKQTEIIGGGPFGLAPGEWTDDTSMALALAESLIAHPHFEPADLMERFARWWKNGLYSCTGECFDIGNTTRSALARYQATGEPFAGATDEHSAGNGSLMRLAPAVVSTVGDENAARRIAAEQSRITHGAPQAVEACIWFADLLRRAILGEPKSSLLAPGKWGGHQAMRSVVSGASWRGRGRESIRSSGYVIDTLEAALWAVEQTHEFEAALVLAVNLGEDADTVGAVTGQLAGALYGLESIPQRWLHPLAWRSRILAIADALLRRGSDASGRRPDASGSECAQLRCQSAASA